MQHVGLQHQPEGFDDRAHGRPSHGNGSRPDGSGTRSSLRKTRLTNSGAPMASGTARRSRAPSASEVISDDRGGRRQKAEPVDGEHVEEQQRRRHQRHAGRATSRRGRSALAGLRRDLAGDLGEVGLGLLLEAAADAEGDHAAADGEPDADHERKHVGADLLARHRRQARAAIGREAAEGDHEQAGHAIGKLHRTGASEGQERASASSGPALARASDRVRLSPWRGRRPSWRRPSPCCPRP